MLDLLLRDISISKYNNGVIADILLTEYQSISNLYHAVIGFTCIEFIPHNTGSFLTKVFHRYFLNKKPIKQAIRTFLFEEISMGTHSDILVYYGRIPDNTKEKKLTGGRKWILYRYSWAHQSTRPFTVMKPVQCLTCYRLHTIESNARVDNDKGNKHVTVALLCSACGAIATHMLSSRLCVLEDSRPLVSVVDITNWSCKTRGEWCYEIVEPAMESA
jgi:hypothetical protein